MQGNRLTVLPPQIGQLDFLNPRSVIKLDDNPWVPLIEDQLVLGIGHVIEFIRKEEYRYSWATFRTLHSAQFHPCCLQVPLQPAHASQHPAAREDRSQEGRNARSQELAVVSQRH